MANPLRQTFKRLTLAILTPTKMGLVLHQSDQVRGTVNKLKETLPAPALLALKAIYLRAVAVKQVLGHPGKIRIGNSSDGYLYWLDLYGLRTCESNSPACPEAKLINNILIEKGNTQP